MTKMGAAAGLGYLACTVASTAVAPLPPGLGEPAADHLSWYVDHSTGVATMGWMFAIATPLLIAFAIAVADRTRGSGSRTLANQLVVPSAVVSGTCTAVGAAMYNAVALRPAAMTPELAVFSSLVEHAFVAVGFVGLGAFLLSACVAAYESHAGAGWTNVVAAVAGVASLVASTGMIWREGASYSFGYVAWLGLAVWIIALSISMLRTPARRDATAAIAA